jgi:hypothetical protein
MRASPLLIALLITLGCRDATKPNVYVPMYSLTAYTSSFVNTTPTDSLFCQVSAWWPIAEAIAPPWSGIVSVRAWRWKRGDVPSAVTREGSALLTLARGPGDSVRATLEGALNLTFNGRMPDPGFFSATGQWTCDASTALGGSAPGDAKGIWYLQREYPID